MELLNGLTIHNEWIELDGKHFVGCTLVDCVLRYSGGDVIFDRTRMRGCRHLFYGRARRTLHYLQNVGLMDSMIPDWGELNEQVH